MSCNCKMVNPIPACAQNIKLGAYVPGKQVNIYFTTATGRVDTFTTTATQQGTVQLPTPGLRLNTPYTVTLTETADARQTNMQWLIGSTAVDCITLTFVPEATQENCYNPELFEVSLIS